ncbi:tRNA (N(6)-L-threonylcarbamoyladenosine(37)-C(2))-methylthiotransferase MtaB [Labrys miyagiensis]|uniref:tRNA (N(6)-L-threonylcarbamoyladenosine(37)-C(2))-methylthiotransferase MtaB n=1 Tax=Labrys miyagiensis TaxID=346912 RepID=A0ABQ6CAF3_9HYPH|nr:tRNA (N(6)-L-threonylcarbamoyladenosine(37)-C(2))-methylthiotransferase MtaB [Labrys miyagiensis]GLS17266.1 tRNA (N(6)-L-threonylcarbamoyladenosine(37)-C(2))-methylthiotransferase MtaB [Labrys miyagiensis]
MTEIVTFGCRLNIHESEAMKAAIGKRDDLTVINSCAVTAEAARQARQAIRRLKRENPERRIAVTGCAAQTDAARFIAMPEVAFVVGNAEKLKSQTWHTLGTTPDKLVTSDIMAARDIALPEIGGFEGRARGFVQIQNGCDHRCTFCIIPFGRGNSRSLAPETAIAQIRRLTEAGYKEIVLTGVDLTSYGPDLAEPLPLGALVRRILKEVPELPRLRLSSIDSVEADADLLRALAEEERLMPHLHLSLQSGDDLILKRMKRRHLRSDAIGFCAEARRLRPDITFGADLIAGFPTEDEAMFARSLDLIEACGITYLHAFPFSPRPGTPAARMPPVDGVAIKKRAARLREAGEAALTRFLDSEIGRKRMILMERGGIGRTTQFAPIRPETALPAGGLVEIEITGRNGRELTGRLATGAAG